MYGHNVYKSSGTGVTIPSQMSRSVFETTINRESPSRKFTTHRSVRWSAFQSAVNLSSDRREAAAASTESGLLQASTSASVSALPEAEQMAGRSMELRVYRDSYATPWGFRVDGGADIGRPISVKRVRTIWESLHSYHRTTVQSLFDVQSHLLIISKSQEREIIGYLKKIWGH